MTYTQFFNNAFKAKLFALLICFPMLLTPTTWAADAMLPIKPEASISNAEQKIIDLSKTKWQWMAERNVDELDKLFHAKSVFVHMSRTMSKAQELEVIRSGGIEYKKADIHEVSVN
ncbi:MAG TPA: nuclear transport factor 2 family protein, partial [Cellvibrio sp.]|nr:nuclear transport factor 2 family protein [Cellvibrio sp.]